MGTFWPPPLTVAGSDPHRLAYGDRVTGPDDAHDPWAMDHPAVAAARRVALDVLAPAAAQVDAGSVPRSHLDALAAAGLLGLQAPASDGGTAAAAPVARAVAEVLAGADCATWFVQAQHHGPVAMLAASQAPVRDRLLPALVRGEVVSGIAFSHLRRYADRPVTATPARGGWRFEGTAPWYTGWGLNDVLLLAGLSAEDDVIFALVDAVPSPGLRAGAPLRTLALAGASTVSLDLVDLHVDEADVVLRVPYAHWAAADAVSTANVNPAVFGVTAAAARLLREAARASGEAATGRAAAAARAALTRVRGRCYHLLDDAPAGESLAERLAARADALALMTTATTALVAAGAGRSVAEGAAAQRLAREALFLTVQAQTRAVRAATLDRLATQLDAAGR